MLWHVVLPIASGHLYRGRGDGDWSAAFIRFDCHHDPGRAVPAVAGIGVLHVRERTVRIRLSHGLRQCDCDRFVPDHDGLHRGFLYKMYRDEQRS